MYYGHCPDHIADTGEECPTCQIRLLRAEVERLKAEKAKSSELWLAQTAAFGDAVADNTRLREALEASNALLLDIAKAYEKDWVFDFSRVTDRDELNRAALRGESNDR